MGDVTVDCVLPPNIVRLTSVLSPMARLFQRMKHKADTSLGAKKTDSSPGDVADTSLGARADASLGARTKKTDTSLGLRADSSLGASTQKKNISLGASTKKRNTSLGASMQETDTSLGASTQKKDTSLVASTQKTDTSLGLRADTTWDASAQKNNTSLGASTQKKDTSLGASTQKKVTSLGASTQKKDTSLGASTQKKDTSLVASTQKRNTSLGAIMQKKNTSLGGSMQKTDTSLVGGMKPIETRIADTSLGGSTERTGASMVDSQAEVHTEMSARSSSNSKCPPSPPVKNLFAEFLSKPHRARRDNQSDSEDERQEPVESVVVVIVSDSEEEKDNQAEPEKVVEVKLENDPGQKEDEHSLSEWTLKPFRHSILLEGHRLGDAEGSCWKSSVITTRHTSRRLGTASGSVYILVGDMDRDAVCMEDFSDAVIEKFSDGFPRNWKDVWRKALHERKRNIKKRVQSESAQEQSTSEVELIARPRRKPTASSDPQGEMCPPDSMKTPEVAKKRPLSKEKTPQTGPVKKPKKTVGDSKNNVTYSFLEPGENLDISKLPVTRSGRKVVPQLAWWAQQRVTTHGNETQIAAGTKNVCYDNNNLFFSPKPKRTRKRGNESLKKNTSRARTNTVSETVLAERPPPAALSRRSLPAARTTQATNVAVAKTASKSKSGQLTEPESQSEKPKKKLTRNEIVQIEIEKVKLRARQLAAKRTGQIIPTESDLDSRSQRPLKGQNAMESDSDFKTIPARGQTMKSGKGQTTAKGHKAKYAIESQSESDCSLKPTRRAKARRNVVESDSESTDSKISVVPQRARSSIGVSKGQVTGSGEEVTVRRTRSSTGAKVKSTYSRGQSDSDAKTASNEDEKPARTRKGVKVVTETKGQRSRGKTKAAKAGDNRAGCDNTDRGKAGGVTFVKLSNMQTSPEKVTSGPQRGQIIDEDMFNSSFSTVEHTDMVVELETGEGVCEDVEDDILAETPKPGPFSLRTDILDILEKRKNSRKATPPARIARYNNSPRLSLNNVIRSRDHGERYFLKKAMLPNAPEHVREKVANDSPYIALQDCKSGRDRSGADVYDISSSEEDSAPEAVVTGNARKKTGKKTDIRHSTGNMGDNRRNNKKQSKVAAKTKAKKADVLAEETDSSSAPYAVMGANIADNKRTNPKPSKAPAKKKGKKAGALAEETDSSSAPYGGTRENNMAAKWTLHEVKLLSQALLKVPDNAPDYWALVSCLVKTRSAEQCRVYHYKDRPHSITTNKTALQKHTVTKVAEITGGKGTLKRKRQIRELMENHDKDHEDDLFSATPYRRKAKAIKLSVDSGTEDDLFSSVGAMYQTPGVKPRAVGALNWTPGMTGGSNTPLPSFVSPGILNTVNRNDCDLYMNRIKKSRRVFRGNSRPTIPGTGSSQEMVGNQPMTARLTNVGINSALFTLKEVSDNEGEENSDYYFSDNDS